MMPGQNRPGKRVTLIILQCLLVLFVLIPFFWMFSVSLKPPTEPFSIPARLWPIEPTLSNYVNAFRPEFRTYFINSLIVSSATIVITVCLALGSAYCFSRSKLALLSVLMGMIVLAQMFPHSAIIIPIYKMMRSANFLDTYASLIAAYVSVTLPVAIWILHGFLAKLPVSLLEAAMLDNAGPFRRFWYIVVPLSRPGLLATGVYVLIVTWQEFLFALSFTSSKDMRTLPVGLNDFIGQYGIRYGELMASSVMVSVPVVAAFFLLQRHFVAGVTAGAVKG